MNNFTWGYEIEWGDIDRRIEIPKKLGSWDYSETDVINTRPPYQNIAADPLGIKPRFGGEINTRPTAMWNDQVDRIIQLKDLFTEQGCPPTASSISHGHIHVHVPGLDQDIEALKKLVAYIRDNQAETVQSCGQFKPAPEIKGSKGATQYLKLDGGRLMPEYIITNILERASNFAEFIWYHCAGKDGVSRGRPFRYAINTYCMKHTRTIEFRFFRATVEYAHLVSMFSFVERFMEAALNGGPSVREILATIRYDFPPFVFNLDEFNGWGETRYPKKRGTKQRRFYAVE